MTLKGKRSRPRPPNVCKDLPQEGFHRQELAPSSRQATFRCAIEASSYVPVDRQARRDSALTSFTGPLASPDQDSCVVYGASSTRAMRTGRTARPFGSGGGIVEVDETFIGHDKTIKPKHSKKGRGYAQASTRFCHWLIATRVTPNPWW